MEPPSPYSIDVVNETGRRVGVAGIKSAVRATLRAQDAPPSSLCVLLTTDESVRELNLRFRNVDESTDVLSFPSATAPGPRAAKRRNLGDIAIAVPYAGRQAQARNVPLPTELAYLAIHGVLHLLGYDDETEIGRTEMQRTMARAAIVAGLVADSSWASILHGEEAQV